MNLRKKRDGNWPLFGLVALTFSAAPVAVADEAAMLQRFHGAIVNPDKVISEDRGEKTREFLDGRNISPDAMSGDEKAAGLQLEVFTELARGNAAGAAKWFDQLAALLPDEKLTQQAGYLVGVASGNAELADRSLSKMASGASANRDALRGQAEQQEYIARRLPQHEALAKLGIAGDADDNVVTVVDIWAAGDENSVMRDAALSRAHADYGKQENVRFIGICADVETTAKGAAHSTRRTWPQLYADTGAFDAIKNALAVKATPTLLVVDAKGWIRSAASATDPAFHYALRAAAHEADGKFVKNVPRDRAGLAAYAEPSKSEVVKPAPPAAPEKPALTNSPEAEKLLERARLFTRTGKKNDAKVILQQILDEYPNTVQAEEAESRLRAL